MRVPFIVKYLYVIIVAAAMTIAVRDAFAETMVDMRGTVLCDTPKQVIEIILALRDDPEKGRALLREYNNTKNKDGEPACTVIGFEPEPVVGVATRTVAGVDNFGPRKITAYVVEIEAGGTFFYALSFRNISGGKDI